MASDGASYANERNLSTRCQGTPEYGQTSLRQKAGEQGASSQGGSRGLESSCGSVSNINIFVGSWEPRAGLGLRHAGNTHSESGPGLVREWAVGDRAGRGECAGHARGYDSLGSMTLIQFSSEHRRASSSNSITVISPPVLRCPLE